jgi:hypothetical protein
MCLTDALAAATDLARSRGEAWAHDIGTALGYPDWPTDSEVLIAVARVKVIDLGKDPRLIELLAGELLEAACTRWRSRNVHAGSAAGCDESLSRT